MKGFTLVEVLISLLILSVVSAAGLVFHVESNMDDVQSELEKQAMHIKANSEKINSPKVQEVHTQLLLLEQRVQMLEKQLEKVSK